MKNSVYVEIDLTETQREFLGRLLEHATGALKLMNVPTVRFEKLMMILRETTNHLSLEIEDAEDFHEITMTFLQFSLLSEDESPEVSDLRELFLNGIVAYWKFLDEDVEPSCSPI